MHRAIDWNELLALSADWYWEQDAALNFTLFIAAELEAAGMAASDYLGRPRWETPHHGVSAAQWAEHRAALERREAFRDFIVGRYRRDGSECFVAISGQPMLDAGGRFLGYRGVGRDVTALVRAERALRASESSYRALSEVSPAAIYVQVGGILRYVNPAAVRLFGESRAGDVIGRPLLDYIHRDERADVAERMRRVRDEGASYPPTVRTFLRRDGTLFTGEVSVVPHVYQGEAGSIAVVRDVTERQRAEEATRRLNAELEARVRQRTAQLQRLNDELESFSYSVSHDLRAPLRAIQGFSGLLAQKADARLDDQGRHYLERVQDAAARMGRLIDDLLELALVVRAPVRPEPIDLSRLALQVVDELRAGEPRRRVAVAVAPALAARGDPALLRLVLQNLLENAWKFTRLREGARIEVGAQGAAGERAFYVRDNGAGFDMAYAGKLFGAFQRLHSEEQFPGTGIGLATVKRIVERHGGRVWAEGEPGLGAAFYFTLAEQ